MQVSASAGMCLMVIDDGNGPATRTIMVVTSGAVMGVAHVVHCIIMLLVLCVAL